MKIAKVSGTVTSTVKNKHLQGKTLLLVDVEDGTGNVLERSVVAVDTCGAGVGDMVLITTGSSARIPDSLSISPVDAAAVAVVDRIGK